jgi:hypothetical protein
MAQAREQVISLTPLTEQAAGVQRGRDPSDPQEVYDQTILLVAEGLLGRTPTAEEAQKLKTLYHDRVRAPGAPKSQAELIMDSEAARRVLADPHLGAGVSSKVTSKAGQYAQALGGLLFTDGAGGAVIVGRRDPSAPLTQAELSRIADMPRVQIPGGLAGLNTKVPAPVSAISAKAPKMGEPGFDYGWATSSYKFWNDMDNRQGDLVSDGKRGVLTATLVSTGATIMKGFYHMSGFGAVEQSSDQLRWDHNREASTGTQVKDSGMLVLNTGLAVLNFVPVFGLAGEGGTTLLRTAKGGSEIVELGGGVGRGTAGEAANEIRTVISNAAGKGGQVTTKNARAILAGLRETGSETYGITVIEDRSLLGMGSATGDAGTIVINTRMGAAHEVTHAVQQAQVRFSLLKQMGKTYPELSETEKVLFANRVGAVETIGYNQFEQGAFRATGFMGSGSLRTARYAEGLEANVQAFEGALAGGTVPKIGAGLTRYTPGTWAYGELPNLLGRSQAQIAWNLGAVVSMSRPLAPVADKTLGAGFGYVFEKGFDMFYGQPEPLLPPNPHAKRS